MGRKIFPYTRMRGDRARPRQTRQRFIYPLQLILFNLSSSVYCLQLTIFSLLSPAYYLQLTIFNLLSSAYCAQDATVRYGVEL